MCVAVLPAYMSVYFVHAWFLVRLEEDVQSLGTGIRDGCRLPCECWELNPSPLQVQPVLLTTEPPPQPHAVSCCTFTVFLLLVGNQPGPNCVCFFRCEVAKVCHVF